MRGSKARLARKLAFDEAKRSTLWDKAVMPKPSFWQRVAIVLTPWKRKAREADALDRRGRWYKWAIKRMTGQAKAILTDHKYLRELESFNRARAKINRKHELERAEARETPYWLHSQEAFGHGVAEETLRARSDA